MSNLRHTPVGATVTVRKIEGEGATRRRIMDMGITRGAEIYVNILRYDTFRGCTR